MRTDSLFRKLHEFKLSESGASHLAIGALLLMTVLYATTMV